MSDCRVETTVDISYVKTLLERNQYLERELAYEKKRRRELEDELEKLKKQTKPKQKRKKYTDDELIEAVSEYKSNGVRKSKKADSIRNFDDFVQIRDLFAKNNNAVIGLRTQMLWTIGIATGLRISDITRLRYCHFYEDDFTTMRKRLKTIEKKTSKVNEVLITEVMRMCVERLREVNNPKTTKEYIFTNIHGERLQEKAAYKDIAYPCKNADLPFHVATHTMRRSFLNIAACIDSSSLDSFSFTKIQGLANHSDPTITMRYLGSYQIMYDKARETVSDFLLGKTDKKDITPDVGRNISDLYAKIERIEDYIEKNIGED